MWLLNKALKLHLHKISHQNIFSLLFFFTWTPTWSNYYLEKVTICTGKPKKNKTSHWTSIFSSSNTFIYTHIYMRSDMWFSTLMTFFSIFRFFNIIIVWFILNTFMKTVFYLNTKSQSYISVSNITCCQFFVSDVKNITWFVCFRRFALI